METSIDRNLLVHHGGVYAIKYHGQRFRTEPISNLVHWNSLTVSIDDFGKWHSFLSRLSDRSVSARPPGCLYPRLQAGRDSPVEYWRVPSLYHIQTELAVYASPYREWLDSEIDVAAIAASPESLTKLWYYEITPKNAPRQWVRGTFELLQAFHKVTSGNPADSQLSSHLVDVDVLVSADRNFVRFAEKCRADAPFTVAQAHLVTGGERSIGVAGAGGAPAVTQRCEQGSLCA